MNLEEFRVRAKEIRDNAEAEVKELGKELAFSNASAKTGDTVTAKHGRNMSIVVDDIKFSMQSFTATEETPECVYFGFVLTKAGRLRKDGERGRIFESDLLSIEKEGE